MYYNFIVYLIVLAIISPFAAYSRSKILEKLDIKYEIMIISIMILLIYSIGIIFTKGKLIPEKLENDTICYLLLNSVFATIALYLSAKLLINDNVFKVKCLQRPIQIIFLVIIASLIYGQEMNWKVILGIILLIMGVYLIDDNISLKLK